MNERIKEIQVLLQYHRDLITTLEAEEQAILRCAENNTFTVLCIADAAMYNLLEQRASDDCEGSYNCGDEVYTQEFMVGTQKYLATMTFEYNRHDKTYYYIDGSEYSSAEM